MCCILVACTSSLHKCRNPTLCSPGVRPIHPSCASVLLAFLMGHALLLRNATTPPAGVPAVPNGRRGRVGGRVQISAAAGGERSGRGVPSHLEPGGLLGGLAVPPAPRKYIGLVGPSCSRVARHKYFVRPGPCHVTVPVHTGPGPPVWVPFPGPVSSQYIYLYNNFSRISSFQYVQMYSTSPRFPSSPIWPRLAVVLRTLDLISSTSTILCIYYNLHTIRYDFMIYLHMRAICKSVNV